MSTTPTPEPAAAERRPGLRQSDIIRLLLERGSTEHSSVTLGRNSKGDTTIEVIVRTDERGEARTIEDAEVLAVAVYERLRTAYPFGGEPAGGATG